jgi:hypothetical protein
VSVSGININVATDGYGAYVVSNVKTWVAGSLVWYKYDNASNLLGGATFEVCRTYDRFGVDIPDECVTVLDNSFPDADPDNGEFKLINLLLGRYTITETVPPVGFEGDAFVETIELTLQNPNGVATHAWVNIPYQGCTPGFWQGGNDFGTAGGKWLWNEMPDPQWPLSGGQGTNPYMWTTPFNDKFSGGSGDMWYYINPDLWGQGENDDFHKAARSLVAAYLNASWGMNYPYDTSELMAMWADALANGKLLELHNKLDLANNAYYRNGGGDYCPISASGY